MYSSIKVRRIPTNNEPVPLCVRLYVVKGIDLKPKDSSGKSDPYLVVSLGGNEKLGNCQRIDDRFNYLPKTINPTFGKYIFT